MIGPVGMQLDACVYDDRLLSLASSFAPPPSFGDRRDYSSPPCPSLILARSEALVKRRFVVTRPSPGGRLTESGQGPS